MMLSELWGLGGVAHKCCHDPGTQTDCPALMGCPHRGVILSTPPGSGSGRLWGGSGGGLGPTAHGLRCSTPSRGSPWDLREALLFLPQSLTAEADGAGIGGGVL